MLPDSPEILASLPAWHLRYLWLWARLKEQSQSELIQTVVQARVEANQDQIDRMLADLAELESVTVTELKTRIWQEFGIEDEGADRFSGGSPKTSTWPSLCIDSG